MVLVIVGYTLSTKMEKIMNELNSLSLVIEVMNCCERPHHRTGIFLKYQADVESAYRAAIKLAEESSEDGGVLQRKIARKNDPNLEFKNGSIMQFRRVPENARGYAFHSVLYDPRIEDEPLYQVIYHTEKIREET